MRDRPRSFNNNNNNQSFNKGSAAITLLQGNEEDQGETNKNDGSFSNDKNEQGYDGVNDNNNDANNSNNKSGRDRYHRDSNKDIAVATKTMRMIMIMTVRITDLLVAEMATRVTNLVANCLWETAFVKAPAIVSVVAERTIRMSPLPVDITAAAVETEITRALAKERLIAVEAGGPKTRAVGK